MTQIKCTQLSPEIVKAISGKTIRSMSHSDNGVDLLSIAFEDGSSLSYNFDNYRLKGNGAEPGPMDTRNWLLTIKDNVPISQ